MILADKIITLRKKNGWSQEELAEKLNVTRQSVSKWEGPASISGPHTYTHTHTHTHTQRQHSHL